MVGTPLDVVSYVRGVQLVLIGYNGYTKGSGSKMTKWCVMKLYVQLAEFEATCRIFSTVNSKLEISKLPELQNNVWKNAIT